MATSVKTWSSREEYKAAKQLEEARKAGTAPPAQDELGNDINPHIPSYIATAPWYLSLGQPSLKHQRKSDFGLEHEQQYDDIHKWYARGQVKGTATKFRPGACKNCGAMTHKDKECTDRPRKLGAWKTGKDIKPDEVIVDVTLDFEGKRDRWNGYDPRMYQLTMERYQEQDFARRKKIAEERAAKFMTEPDAAHKKYPHEGGSDSNNKKKENSLVDDEDKQNEDEARKIVDDSGDQFSKRDPRTRTTVRNLRIREDRAKYLDDLNPSSAFYDPKSRSLRGDFQDSESSFVSSGQQVFQGDSAKFFEMHKYAWDACNDNPTEIPNMFAEPSAVEVLFEEMNRRKSQVENDTKNKLAKEYGGEEYMKAPPSALLLGQTENYKEYTRDGSLIKGAEPIPKSKYPEDVHINKHNSVFGSFYDKKTGKWGFSCCRQLDKASFCTGSLRRTETGSARAEPDDEQIVHTTTPAKNEIRSLEGQTSFYVKEEKKRKREAKTKSEDSDEDSDSHSSEHSKRKKHKHKSSRKKRKSE